MTASRWRLRLRAALPAPILSGLLLGAWLMLNQSLSLGQFLLGLLLAWAVPLLTHRQSAAYDGRSQAENDRPVRLHRLAPAARLAGVLLLDILLANVEVARRVLGPEAALRPCFVWVPLRLRSPQAVALLATIVTLTPGTVSSQLSDDGLHLLVHALHCTDEAALVASIQARYETPLLEIFA
jgi:multicomponent K+:H+ antiporter subunit E